MAYKKEITGYYLQHYERGILSKLTEYADPKHVRVKNGVFRAKLNQTLPAKSVEDLLWNLEHALYAFSIHIKGV